jgi:hypothetical protein
MSTPRPCRIFTPRRSGTHRNALSRTARVRTLPRPRVRWRSDLARWSRRVREELLQRWMAALVEAATDDAWKDVRATLEGQDVPAEAISRRNFLALVGVSAALAGVGCSRGSHEKVLPYTRAPVDVVAGMPSPYATSMELAGFASGLLVQARDGRPIKVEGNPAHPASLGASDVWSQAAILQLYDPQRARSVLHRGRPSSLEAFAASLAPEA